MKKFIAIAFGAAVCGAAYALDSAPQAYPGLMINGISPNGAWVASNEGGLASMSIINRESGREYSYAQSDTEYYTSGAGHYVSDTGIVLGSTTFDGDAAYWEKGSWKRLPLRATDVNGAFANAITPDGSRITGIVNRSELSLDTEQLMTIPVYWDRNDDGSYADYVELPVPATDFTGRMPQYILAVDINADGTVIAGQIRDYAGFNPQPIVFREDAHGAWTYQALHTELFVPAGVTYPAWPGEAPSLDVTQYLTAEEMQAFDDAVAAWDSYSDSEPQPTQFMTADEKAAYEQALATWNWDYDPFGPNKRDYMTDAEYDAYIAAVDAFYAAAPEYPQYTDFMSPEALAQYNADRAAYDEQYDVWEAAYADFMEAYISSAVMAPTFAQNNVILSPDGRYYATTDYLADYMTNTLELTPYVFDLQSGDVYKYPGQQTYVNFVNNDGATLGGKIVLQEAGLYNACISTAPGEAYQPLQDYLKSNDNLYEWMDLNLCHDYVEYYFNPVTQQVEERHIYDTWMSGMPVATPDLSVIATWSGAWNDSCTEYYYSFVMPTGIGAGIHAVGTDTPAARLTRGAVLTVTGPVARVTIADLYGRIVYDAPAPASGTHTNLRPGLYLVRATALDGTSTVTKCAF